MNKLFPLIIAIPLLMGCQSTYQYHSFSGEKITLDYVENGALIEISATEVASFAEDDKSFICLFGIPNCSSCASVKKNLESYSIGNNCNTYHIDMEKVKHSQSDMDKLKIATTGYYQWGEKESYPLVYFFFKGDVAFRCGESDVTTFIENYVEVASSN